MYNKRTKIECVKKKVMTLFQSTSISFKVYILYVVVVGTFNKSGLSFLDLEGKWCYFHLHEQYMKLKIERVWQTYTIINTIYSLIGNPRIFHIV